MPVLDVHNVKGKKISQVELADEVFSVTVKTDVLHQVVTMQLANRRAGTAAVKHRSDVRGSRRKLYRQKGTGRARQGSTRAAQWVGGGKVHTPHPRDYSKRMPRKMRRAALRSALSAVASESRLVVLDELSFDQPKTRTMEAALAALVGQASALILMPGRDETVEKSVRNLPAAKILRANYLNVRDLLGYDHVIMPLGALDIIQSYLGE